MADDSYPTAPPTEILKALGDPIRWSIVTQMAAVPELACLTLEGSLPVSKPTISYHTKILHHAGLISVRKEGRNYFYSLRRDVLGDLMDSLSELAPAPGPAAGLENGHGRAAGRWLPPVGTPTPALRHTRDQPEPPDEAVVLTW